MIPTTFNDRKVCKHFKKKSKLVLSLWRNWKIEKLRALRDRSTDIDILIYHNSAGTDSYYHDKEGRYYTWLEVEAYTNAKLAADQKTIVVVFPWKAGVHFTKSTMLKNLSLN